MVQNVAPPGWPHQVRPPDAPAWERTAENWLLDICPPEYRTYPALRRHDMVLARFAVLHVEACQAAVQRGAPGLLEDEYHGAGIRNLEAAERWLSGHDRYGELEDEPSGRDTDFYYLRVAQENGQWAWSSPIWVDGA